jgi:hypothetical protein
VVRHYWFDVFAVVAKQFDEVALVFRRVLDSDELEANPIVDFSRVDEKRAARAADPAATSAEAEAILSVIEPLIADEATDNQKKHAVALGIVKIGQSAASKAVEQASIKAEQEGVRARLQVFRERCSNSVRICQEVLRRPPMLPDERLLLGTP